MEELKKVSVLIIYGQEAHGLLHGWLPGFSFGWFSFPYTCNPRMVFILLKSMVKDLLLNSWHSWSFLTRYLLVLIVLERFMRFGWYVRINGMTGCG